MPVTKPKQVVLLLYMTYLTFLLDVPYYYVKGENVFYSLFLLFIIMLILIKRDFKTQIAQIRYK